MKYAIIILLLFTGVSTQSCGRDIFTAMIIKPNGTTKYKRMSRSKCQRKFRRQQKSRHSTVKGYGIR